MVTALCTHFSSFWVKKYVKLNICWWAATGGRTWARAPSGGWASPAQGYREWLSWPWLAWWWWSTSPLSLLFFLMLFPKQQGARHQSEASPLPAAHKGRQNPRRHPYTQEPRAAVSARCPVPPPTQPCPAGPLSAERWIWRRQGHHSSFPVDAVFLLLLLESFQISLGQLLSDITTSQRCSLSHIQSLHQSCKEDNRIFIF